VGGSGGGEEDDDEAGGGGCGLEAFEGRETLGGRQDDGVARDRREDDGSRGGRGGRRDGKAQG
jgi:hypothetical protein